MLSVSAAGRAARDKKLALAAGVLILAGLLELVANSLRLSELLDGTGRPVENMIASWLEVVRALPLLAAGALALVAFLVAGEARHRWLRRAFLLAALASAIGLAAGALDFAAIADPSPHELNVALGAQVLSRLCLFLAALAASAFSAERDAAGRETILGRAALLVAATFAFAAISAFEFAVAFSRYSHHNAFVGGLVVQGLGSLGAVVAGGIAAAAFRRRAGSGGDEPRLVVRERRLFRSTVVLTLGFLVVALGEAQTAAGSAAIGFPQSSAVASWLFATARVVYAAAVACAALGFSRAAARRG